MKDKIADRRRLVSKEEYQKRDYSRCRMTVADRVKTLAAGACLCLVLDYLFYEDPFVLLFMCPLPFFFMKLQEKRMIKRRKRELNYQFKDALVSLSVAIRAGYSPENAVNACSKDLESIYPAGTDIVEEFHYMQSRIRVSVPADELFRDLGRRSRVEDIENFASVLSVCRRMGGDMSAVIQKCAGMVADKIDVHREIETSIASKKAEQNIMSIMPAGIIMYIKLACPGFLDKMYGNAFGVTAMTVCLIIYAAAFFLGRKIVDIEV